MCAVYLRVDITLNDVVLEGETNEGDGGGDKFLNYFFQVQMNYGFAYQKDQITGIFRKCPQSR